MKFKKIIFTLSLIGILLIIVLVQNTEQIQTGKINSIKYSEDRMTIELENFKEKLIIFDPKTINLKKGDTIKFQGKQEIYKNEGQVIVYKIWKINNS